VQAGAFVLAVGAERAQGVQGVQVQVQERGEDRIRISPGFSVTAARYATSASAR